MRRPAAALVLAAVAALTVLSLAGVFSKRRHSPVASAAAARPPRTETVSASAPADPAPVIARATRPPKRSKSEIDRQDPYNGTGAFKRYLRGQSRQPAYQHLPYRTDEVHIRIVNITSDGRIVLQVTPLGLNVNPRVAYAHFLSRYHDPGGDYLPQYGRFEP